MKLKNKIKKKNNLRSAMKRLHGLDNNFFFNLLNMHQRLTLFKGLKAREKRYFCVNRESMDNHDYNKQEVWAMRQQQNKTHKRT